MKPINYIFLSVLFLLFSSCKNDKNVSEKFSTNSIKDETEINKEIGYSENQVRGIWSIQFKKND